MTVELLEPSEVTLSHTDLHTHTHAHTHTPTLLADTEITSVTTEVSHEASVDDLDRRFHGRLVGSPPCESLSAGQTSSACRNRSDRDIPPNAELEDGEIPQHSRDLEDDVNSPCEQPWQCDLRLRRHDDWYSDDDEQIRVSGAARNGNRKPRFYRDGEIPYSRLEVVSCRLPRQEPDVLSPEGDDIRHTQEPEVNGRAIFSSNFDTSSVEQANPVNDEQYNRRDVPIHNFSTTGTSDMGLEMYRHSSDRVVNPALSTIGAPERGAGNDGKPALSTIDALQRGAEVGINSWKDPALGFKTGVGPQYFYNCRPRHGARIRVKSADDMQHDCGEEVNHLFSTTGASNVGLEESKHAPRPHANPVFSTLLITNRN